MLLSLPFVLSGLSCLPFELLAQTNPNSLELVLHPKLAELIAHVTYTFVFHSSGLALSCLALFLSVRR